MSPTQTVTPKWATLASLPVLAIATYLGWYWVWGLLFVYWGLSSAVAGQAYLVEPLNRVQHPVLFWTVSTVWVAFGAWYVAADLLARL